MGRNITSPANRRSLCPLILACGTTLVTIVAPAAFTVLALIWRPTVDASSADGSTSVRSQEPRFALTSRQPSSLTEICSGDGADRRAAMHRLDGSRSTMRQWSASSTDSSPLALLGRNANCGAPGDSQRGRREIVRGALRMAVLHRPTGDVEIGGGSPVAPLRVARRAGAEGAQAHERQVGRAVEIVRRQDVGRRAASGGRDRGDEPEAKRGSSHRGTVLGKPIRWITWYWVSLVGSRSTTEMLLSPNPTT